MKKKITLLAFLFLSIAASAQSLQQNVYSSIVLGADTFAGVPLSNGCYDYSYSFYSNLTPYVTGMNLAIVINRIRGAVDSIQVYRNPDINYSYLKANDTIQLNSLSYIYFYFLAADTLITSLIAYGTPQIAGENYYCNYSGYRAFTVDGCSPFSEEFSGGTGPFDTLLSCSVLGITGIVETENAGFTISPSPATDFISLKFPSGVKDADVRIFNVSGQMEYFSSRYNSQEIINLANLNAGIYIIEISTSEKSIRQKFLRK